jgi:hypothetical protein
MAQRFAGTGERASDGVKSASACRAKRPDLLLGNLNLLVVCLELADYRPSTDTAPQESAKFFLGRILLGWRMN